jgi:Cu/Zn superoxide dismutase
MKLLRNPLRAVVIASALAFVSMAAHAATVTLKADLQPSSEVKDSQGHGMLTATFNTESNLLKYHATYEGLTGAAVAAHFHGPAEPGENAGPQVPVAKPLDSPINGKATLTPEQAKELLDGKWYFNVHTAKNPGGEIRGQVTKE